MPVQESNTMATQPQTAQTINIARMIEGVCIFTVSFHNGIGNLLYGIKQA
jgi:hypothetical protein